MVERKLLSCRDLNVDCDFESEGATVEEVIERCAAHASSMHGMKSFPPELWVRMRANTRSIRVEER